MVGSENKKICKVRAGISTNSKSSHMLVQVSGEQKVSVWGTLVPREVNEQVQRRNPRGQRPQEGEGELLVA